ncbi:MAG: DUF4197 domain-containing protein [Proteobacteria bacterium]|nr:DUF4197 domain-containing protein [Pseudomonadota bacterium]MBU1596048.1 DUF4197 domain-containing protein [Pseudomonadota bacterium]
MKRAMTLALVLSCCATPALAGWADVLDKVQSNLPAASAGAAPGVAGNLSDADYGKGLKDALAQGVKKAVTSLGATDGYFGNEAVKILLPEQLQKLETPLRLAGQGKLVDDLMLAMNRAAEKAVPQAANILGDAVRAMSVQDAHGILTGPQDAATQYFRKTSGAKIGEMMQPIIVKSMDSVGVAKAYNRLTANPIAASVAQSYGLDLNSYVGAKAQDGLFTLIAKEEQNIRANPAARTTDMLRKVFGAK